LQTFLRAKAANDFSAS